LNPPLDSGCGRAPSIATLTLVVGIWLVVIGLFEIAGAFAVGKDITTITNAVRG
jgi:hypothetical protein